VITGIFLHLIAAETIQRIESGQSRAKQVALDIPDM
jgi:hypothetical protein